MNSTAYKFRIDFFISDLSMRRTSTASGSLENLKGHHEELYPHYHLVMSRHSIYIRTVLEIVTNELRRFKHSADFFANSSHIIESAAISAS